MQQQNPISTDSVYDADYFERGIQSGKSLFENYQWMPHLTIPMAMVIIDYLGIKRGETILDFGCAKGYMVKALRWLGRNAFGYDISEYAINNSDVEVKEYVSLETYPACKYCVAKDVLEHLDEDQLYQFLIGLSASVILAIIPLGENDKFVIPAYNLDITHKLAKPLPWWISIFKNTGWIVSEHTYRILGIKDNWASYAEGNIFITAKRTS